MLGVDNVQNSQFSLCIPHCAFFKSVPRFLIQPHSHRLRSLRTKIVHKCFFQFPIEARTPRLFAHDRRTMKANKVTFGFPPNGQTDKLPLLDPKVCEVKCPKRRNGVKVKRSEIWSD